MNSLDKCFHTVNQVLENLPKGWLELTTHRLDIYDEAQAKSQFLQQLEGLQGAGNYSTDILQQLPTAYDYIRLGHPLSCVLEWLLAKINQISAEQVIAFTSKTMPILAILREDTLRGVPTEIYYNGELPPLIDVPRLEKIYGYKVTLNKITGSSQIPEHDKGTVIFVTQSPYIKPIEMNKNIDATINIHPHHGSTIFIHKQTMSNMVKNTQHVRRRETIAMTPNNALNVLIELVGGDSIPPVEAGAEDINKITTSIKENTGSHVTPLIGSSGLSIQYAIMMGLVENAMLQSPGKSISVILPPNCYGGTNDQARRIAALIPDVEIVDLLVDGGQDLVTSLDIALTQVANNDSVPIVLAEIPTNPRVEVPDMDKLAAVLGSQRPTKLNSKAVQPVFMVDQTFCPNVKLLGQESLLANVKVISFSSGSKFPSGGRCIAGYCTANQSAKSIQAIIGKHLALSDNAAVPQQISTLAKNMPSMPSRIKLAYEKTRIFVNHIQQELPHSKINFVSEGLAEQGFTPSVFSLDLPSIGDTKEEREKNKRELNDKLIEFMIKRYPEECKYCVSYGQLKGSYWTIPATSTQGTTKEKDKDYIIRVALSPDTDVTQLSQLFSEFCDLENLT